VPLLKPPEVLPKKLLPMISADNAIKQQVKDPKASLPEYSPTEAHLKGNELFKQKDYQAAIDEYSKEIENSRNSTCLSNRGLCYLNLGKYSLSLKDSLDSFVIDNNQKSITRAVKAAIHLGRLDEAGEYLKQITKPTQAGKETAQLLSKLKALDDRLEAEQDPSKALVLIEEMMVTLEPILYNSRLPNTLSILDTSMTLNIPSSWNLKRAQVLLDLYDANEAGQIGRLILRKDQQNINAIYIVAQSMHMLESHPITTIIQYLSTALSLDPDNKKCRTFYKLIKRLENLKNAGNEGFKERDYEKALESYSEFLDLVDFGITKAKVLSNRAIVYSRQGLHDQVIDDCKEALSILDKLFFPAECSPDGTYFVL
jgi:DnaJ homolog subfamily C member 7